MRPALFQLRRNNGRIRKRAIRIDSEQRSGFQIEPYLSDCRHNVRADDFGIEIVGADLHDARLVSLGCGKDRPEIQITRRDDKVCRPSLQDPV